MIKEDKLSLCVWRTQQGEDNKTDLSLSLINKDETCLVYQPSVCSWLGRIVARDRWHQNAFCFSSKHLKWSVFLYRLIENPVAWWCSQSNTFEGLVPDQLAFAGTMACLLVGFLPQSINMNIKLTGGPKTVLKHLGKWCVCVCRLAN